MKICLVASRLALLFFLLYSIERTLGKNLDKVRIKLL